MDPPVIMMRMRMEWRNAIEYTLVSVLPTTSMLLLPMLQWVNYDSYPSFPMTVKMQERC